MHSTGEQLCGTGFLAINKRTTRAHPVPLPLRSNSICCWGVRLAGYPRLQVFGDYPEVAVAWHASLEGDFRPGFGSFIDPRAPSEDSGALAAPTHDQLD